MTTKEMALSPQPVPGELCVGGSARIAAGICIGLVVASFCSFGLTLDRYPVCYTDEPFYNNPPIRYLEGAGLSYGAPLPAPHAEAVWAYHGPFFPRLQILNFACFGISEYTCRLPQYLSAHLAILGLCGFLIRAACPGSAIVLAVAWLGDRSCQEVLYGRMDGIALLFAALGFMALVNVLKGRPSGWAVACGASLGTAVGFHPITIVFVAVAAALFLLALPAGSRLRALIGLGLGGLLPLIGVLLCWLPDPIACWEQFFWLARKAPVSFFFARLWQLLMWSKYWAAALIVVATPLLIGMAGLTLLERRPLCQRGRDVIWVAAAAFSLAGLCCVARGGFPYYLVYFTPWPTMGLAVLWESRRVIGGIPLALKVAVACCFLSWLPSLAWNGLRFRECITNFRRLDRSAVIARLHQRIPPGIRVMCTPELFLLAREAGLTYAPLPSYFKTDFEVPPDEWLLLTEHDWTQFNLIASSSLASREVVFRGDAFPGVPYLQCPLVVLGPSSATSKERGGSEGKTLSSRR